MVSENKKNNLAEEMAYNEIISAIRNKLILPKRKLVEGVLADVLGMSRTPVRAALKRLEFEGYVESIPNKGTYLISPNKKDILDLYMARVLIEEKNIELAIMNLDTTSLDRLNKCIKNEKQIYLAGNYEEYDKINKIFHMLIAEIGNNSFLYKYTNDLINKCEVFRIIYDSDESCSLPPSVQAHKELLECIEKRNVSQAQQKIKEHILNAMNRINMENINKNKFKDFLSL